MAESLTPSTRIARASDMIAEPMGGGIVMLDLEADRYLRLNATAALIWERLAEPATVAELSSALRERTGIEPERAEADTTILVEQLLELGAAEVSPEVR